MKCPTSILLLIICCGIDPAIAQWNTPQVVGNGLSWNENTYWASELIVHPDVASAVPKNHYAESHSFGMGYYSSIDQKSLRYFFVMFAGTTPYLYTVDLATGSLLSKVTLPDNNFYWWDYPSSSSMLYDVKADRLLALLKPNVSVISDSCWLITIDPMSGNIDTVKNLGDGIFHLIHDGIDENENVAYCMKQNAYLSKDLTLVRIHLDSFSIDQIPVDFSKYDLNYFEYGYNCRNGLIYGIEALADDFKHPLDATLRIVNIEPLTGTRTILTDPINSLLDWGSFAMMPFSDKFYFTADEGGSNYSATINCFDLVTNELSNKYWTGDYRTTMWTGYIPFSTSANFTAQNFCQQGTTQFSTSSNDAFYYQWNFDDLNSGENNFSDQSNPSHVFSDTGWYNVTLITSTCYHSDTLSQWIHIDEFSSLDLGPDTSICPAMAGDEIILHANAPENGTVQWQDYSSDSVFVVTRPGVYYVTITSDCGAITDSITITSGDCNCPMKIIPDLTSNSVTLEIGCSLANYPQIHGDVFNLLGQRVLEFVPASESYQLPVSQLSAGQYIVVVIDGNNRLKTQKIVLVH